MTKQKQRSPHVGQSLSEETTVLLSSISHTRGILSLSLTSSSWPLWWLEHLHIPLLLDCVHFSE